MNRKVPSLFVSGLILCYNDNYEWGNIHGKLGLG